ncbi:MAG: hypothetical protein NT062_10375 [Proteobacteria bacterium]|nr:hypothetical protein [Pseudomonadota bacterium]
MLRVGGVGRDRDRAGAELLDEGLVARLLDGDVRRLLAQAGTASLVIAPVVGSTRTGALSNTIAIRPSAILPASGVLPGSLLTTNDLFAIPVFGSTRYSFELKPRNARFLPTGMAPSDTSIPALTTLARNLPVRASKMRAADETGVHDSQTIKDVPTNCACWNALPPGPIGDFQPLMWASTFFAFMSQTSSLGPAHTATSERSAFAIAWPPSSMMASFVASVSQVLPSAAHAWICVASTVALAAPSGLLCAHVDVATSSTQHVVSSTQNASLPSVVARA